MEGSEGEEAKAGQDAGLEEPLTMLHLQSHCCYLNCYSKQTTLHCATYTTQYTNWPSVKCFRCIVTILAQGLLPSTWYFLQLISLIVHPSSSSASCIGVPVCFAPGRELLLTHIPNVFANSSVCMHVPTMYAYT